MNILYMYIADAPSKRRKPKLLQHLSLDIERLNVPAYLCDRHVFPFNVMTFQLKQSAKQ